MARRVRSESVPVTAKALLGLLTFFDELSAYELKKQADRTLRFFWTAPAMSQVYTELDRLEDLGLVTSRTVPGEGSRITRVFRVSAAGRRLLRDWQEDEPPARFSLKHPVALRLFLGHLATPERLAEVVRDHHEQTTAMLADLQEVREGLSDDAPNRLPIAVAEWGLDYYSAELKTAERLLALLEAEYLTGD